MLDDDEPAEMNSLYSDAAWAAYDAADQDVRRDRWTGIVTAWVQGDDDKVRELIGPLALAELIDLDCTLTSLRYEIRRAISRTNAPWVKQVRPEHQRGEHPSDRG